MDRPPRGRDWRVDVPDVGLSVDLSRCPAAIEGYDARATALASALTAMEALEKGAIANADEHRMVGHYWLRDPDRAPWTDLAAEIEGAQAAVRDFARAVRSGAISGPGGTYRHVVHIGIGGSALGPQLLCASLAEVAEPIQVHFLDNADPDTVADLLSSLGPELGRTLVSVVSKSGWTPTPMHVLREVQAGYARLGLEMARQAVATTVPGSDLDRRAAGERWLGRFPLWDWVGGRTSVTSAVGLLPLALQGGDIDGLLDGARSVDRATRERDPRANPAAMMALCWSCLGEERDRKNMVVLPYRDRLSLFPRYVQQLVMESIGKERDRHDAEVHQGLTVFGNKGSTDQHAYVQQLYEGPADFFVVFVLAMVDDAAPRVDELTGATLGDFLFGYALSARQALYDRGRESITVSVPRVDARAVGALIALFERAVGIYAELIDVNAYHQPSVDKDAAGGVVALQQAVLFYLQESGAASAGDIAAGLGRPDDADTVHAILARLALDPRRGVRRTGREFGLV